MKIPAWFVLSFFLLVLQTNPLTAREDGIPAFHFDGQTVSLKGTWLFFPEKFLSAEEITDWEKLDHQTVAIPSPLPQSNKADGSPAWGTLMIRLQGLDRASQDLGLTIRANTAFHIQLYNPRGDRRYKTVLTVGKTARTAEASLPENVNRIGVLSKEDLGPEIYLVMHISGWHFDSANVWGIPKIAELTRVHRYEDWTRFIETLTLGILMMMSLYFFSFTLRKNHDPAAFWLACLSFFTALRLVLTSGNLLNFIALPPDVITYSIFRKLEYSTIPALAYTGTIFVVRCFGASSLLRFMKFDGWMAVFLFCLCLATPAPLLRSLLLPLNGYLLIHFVLGLWISISSIRVNSAATLAFTIGLTVNFLTALHDIALGSGLTWTTGYFLSPIGVSVLIFSQGQILSINFERAYTLAARLSKDLQKEVDRQTAEVKTIMNSIPQGIMTINEVGKVEQDVSLQVKTILQREHIAGELWSSILLAGSNYSEDQKQIAEESMRMILGEDLMNFDLNQHNLPLEVQFVSGPRKGSCLELTFSPLVTKDNRVERVLITIFDATEKRLEELAAERKEHELRLVRELVAIPAERFHSFRDTAQTTMTEMKQLIVSPDVESPEILRKIYLNAHTLKGSSRTLGLLFLANSLHELENMIEQLRKEPGSRQRQELAERFQSVESAYSEYLNVNDNQLGRQKAATTSISAPKSLLERCSHTLARVLLASKDPKLQGEALDLVQNIAKLTYTALDELLKEAAIDLVKISRDLNKPLPETRLQGEPVFVDTAGAQTLRKALVHVLRNTMDHGIEAPEDRRAKGKSEAGLLSFSWQLDESGISLEIFDDGQGLDVMSLKRKGLELGLISEQEAQDTRKVVDLIFHPNFSTARQITQFSGRGVGMNAVRSYLGDIGGRVDTRLVSTSHKQERLPFHLIISIPKEHVFVVPDVHPLVTEKLLVSV